MMAYAMVAGVMLLVGILIGYNLGKRENDREGQNG